MDQLSRHRGKEAMASVAIFTAITWSE